MLYIMKGLKNSVDHLISEKPSQLILGIIFVIYILLNVQTPAFLATGIDNIFGKVLVVAIAAVIFMKSNPVVGVLGFVVAYQLIKTASITTGTYGMQHYLSSETSKLSEMSAFNPETVKALPTMTKMTSNNAGSLETEMVDQMAPLVMHGGDSNLEYMPILDGQHSAAPLDEA